jgi:hypothetical protein
MRHACRRHRSRPGVVHQVPPALGDVKQAGRRLGADVAEMIREDLDIYPEPSDDKCPPCLYLAPCQAPMNGIDAEPILLTGYRERPPNP